MKRPSFDYRICMCCGICVAACPVSCLSLSKIAAHRMPKAFPQLTPDPRNSCIGCGLCAKSCPLDVITMQETERQKPTATE